MTVHITNVQRARIYEEPAGSFGTDHSGTAGDYKDLPFIAGTFDFKPMEPTQAPGHVQQHQDAYPLEVKLPKRCTISFEINLTGLGLASGGPRSQSALGRLLKVAFGGETLGTGTTVNDAGATTTVIVLTSAAGLAKGMAVAFATGSGGKLEMREIKNISTNTITLKHALSSAPSNGSTVYAPACYYPSTVAGAGAAAASLQIIFEGLEPEDRWLASGGQVTAVGFTLANGAIAKMSFTWEFADWDHADGVATSGDFAGPALAFATYSNALPLVIKDSELRIFDVGTTSLSSTLVEGAHSYEYTTSIAYVPHNGPGGVNNIIHWVRSGTAPLVSGSFTCPLEDQTWWTEKSEDDVKAFALQIGSSPTATTGGGVLLVASAIQITDVQPTDSNGIRAQQVSWKGTIDGDITSPTANSDIHYAAMRIHIF